MSFAKGPIQKLKDGFVRYEICYRVMMDDETWQVYRMWKTDEVGMAEKIGRELRNRLAQKLRQFDIISVRDVGNEVPVQTGSQTSVVTPAEFEAMKQKQRAQFSQKDIEGRAKELGIWVPGMEDKFDA